MHLREIALSLLQQQIHKLHLFPRTNSALLKGRKEVLYKILYRQQALCGTVAVFRKNKRQGQTEIRLFA